MCPGTQDTHIQLCFGVLSDACSLVFPFAAQAPVVPRDLSKWSTEQKKSYRKVAERFQQEEATYYSLLALGLAGSVKLAKSKQTFLTDTETGHGIIL